MKNRLFIYLSLLLVIALSFIGYRQLIIAQLNPQYRSLHLALGTPLDFGDHAEADREFLRRRFPAGQTREMLMAELKSLRDRLGALVEVEETMPRRYVDFRVYEPDDSGSRGKQYMSVLFEFDAQDRLAVTRWPNIGWRQAE